MGKKLHIPVENLELLARDNVIFTPHMAFYSKEAVKRILDTTASNILNFLAGRPFHAVNPPKPG
jgi:D-lactate dehydrogenase